MNERNGEVIKTLLQMTGMIPPDTVTIGGRTIDIDVYREAKEYAEKDPRTTEFIANIILEYVDRIEENKKALRERIRAEVEAQFANKRKKQIKEIKEMLKNEKKTGN